MPEPSAPIQRWYWSYSTKAVGSAPGQSSRITPTTVAVTGARSPSSTVGCVGQVGEPSACRKASFTTRRRGQRRRSSTSVNQRPWSGTMRLIVPRSASTVRIWIGRLPSGNRIADLQPRVAARVRDRVAVEQLAERGVPRGRRRGIGVASGHALTIERHDPAVLPVGLLLGRLLEHRDHRP